MDLQYPQLAPTKVTGIPLPALEYNALALILDRQTHGALEGVGAGVISGGVVSAGGGLTVSVTALQAILDSSDGMVYLQTDSAGSVASLPNAATVYIHAAAVLSEDIADSRCTAAVVLLWDLSNSVADAVLLAAVTTAGGAVTVVTDARTLIPALAAQAAVDVVEAWQTEVETAVGADYFGATPPTTSLHDRVTALESGGGGGGGGGTVYWGALAKTAGDAGTIEGQIDADLAAHVATYHGASGDLSHVQVQEYDVVSANMARGVLRTTRHTDSEYPAYLSDCIVVVHEVTGDGTDVWDFVDHDNSTWVYAP